MVMEDAQVARRPDIEDLTRVCLTSYSQRAKMEAMEVEYDWDIKRGLELMRDITKGMDV